MNTYCNSSGQNKEAVAVDQSKDDHDDEDPLRFHKSLQELRDLRSQIYHAADYCETAFLNADDKKNVVNTTKEYICRAVVTIVDHLGTVSCNLDNRFKDCNNVSEIELRITCLKQKLLSHEYCNQNLSLAEVCWSMDLPRCYTRYISPSIPKSDKPIRELIRESNGIREGGLESGESDGMVSVPKSPTSLVFDAKTGVAPLASALPVRDGFCLSGFHFQVGKNHPKHKRGPPPFSWKSMYDNDVLSLLLRRRGPSKLLKHQV
ncbi:hypothetical protein Dimus_026527 [Dionaea muscipula]